jgi:hypothetical protein
LTNDLINSLLYPTVSLSEVFYEFLQRVLTTGASPPNISNFMIYFSVNLITFV